MSTADFCVVVFFFRAVRIPKTQGDTQKEVFFLSPLLNPNAT